MPKEQEPKANVTELLLNWSRGKEDALQELIPIVYAELRRLAGHHMRRERPGHTLQTTGLVHEAYVRLIRQNRVDWQNRAHFFGVAAQMMRRILVDHARKRQAGKRGAGEAVFVFDESIDLPETDVNLVALDDALQGLEALDPRQGRIVELKYFVGMTIEEIAEVMKISPPTVKREWKTAKLWLRRELRRGSPI